MHREFWSTTKPVLHKISQAVNRPIYLLQVLIFRRWFCVIQFGHSNYTAEQSGKPSSVGTTGDYNRK